MGNLALPQTVETPSPVEEKWAGVLHLPCQVSIDIPVSRFTVAQFLNLETESVVDTGQEASSNVPVLVNRQLIGWGEFELIGEKLGIHLVELV